MGEVSSCIREMMLKRLIFKELSLASGKENRNQQQKI